MIRAAALLIVLAFASCKQKDMTLKELEKAKWDSLDMGVYNITTKTEKEIVSTSDSIKLKLIGMSGEEINPVDISTGSMTNDIKMIIAGLLSLNAINSKKGYLRLNLKEMLMKNLKMVVYLRGDTDDTIYYQFEKDSAALANIPGVKKVKYISKDEGAEIIFGEDKPWQSVLDANPIPSSIELALEQRNWTKQEMEDLKKLILERIPVASDVSYPLPLLKRDNLYYFVQYEWIKK